MDQKNSILKNFRNEKDQILKKTLKIADLIQEKNELIFNIKKALKEELCVSRNKEKKYLMDSVELDSVKALANVKNK